MIKLTLADGKIVIGERKWWDVLFNDGWNNKTVHNAKTYDDKMLLIGESPYMKISNHWVIVTEMVTEKEAK